MKVTVYNTRTEDCREGRLTFQPYASIEGGKWFYNGRWVVMFDGMKMFAPICNKRSSTKYELLSIGGSK